MNAVDPYHRQPNPPGHPAPGQETLHQPSLFETADKPKPIVTVRVYQPDAARDLARSFAHGAFDRPPATGPYLLAGSANVGTATWRRLLRTAVAHGAVTAIALTDPRQPSRGPGVDDTSWRKAVAHAASALGSTAAWVGFRTHTNRALLLTTAAPPDALGLATMASVATELLRRPRPHTLRAPTNGNLSRPPAVPSPAPQAKPLR